MSTVLDRAPRGAAATPSPATRRAAALLATLLLATAAPSAEGAEDELVLAIEPGWALFGPDPSAHGAGANASAWLGLNETLWLTASVGGHASFGGERAHQTLGEALGGLVLALDILRTIPFVEVTIGALVSSETIEPSLRLGAGADYFLTPSISIGAVGRYRPLARDLGGESLLTLNLRLALRLEL